ncbi:MAG: FAD-binding protein [Chloroflexota bacterium]
MNEETIQTDVLILGAGMAGIRAAVEAHDLGANVLLVTKGAFGRDAAITWMAEVGYQCWGISPEDTLDVQVEDTLRCGFFLNNQENVYAFLSHVPDTVRDLVRWGGTYKMKDENHLEPIWQLGCSIPQGRSIYPKFYPRGQLGYIYLRILPPVIRGRAGIQVLDDFFTTDFLMSDGAVAGVLGIDIRTGQFKVLQAKTTLLATGGYEGLYPVTTGNPQITGDGQAMALRAGVDLMDFEFNQTLPSCIWPPAMIGDILPFHLLWDEAWDGRMYNSKGERFISKWDPVKMEHTTRAYISRSIFHEIKEGRASPHGGVYTSVAHLPKDFLEEYIGKWSRTPSFQRIKGLGIDLRKDSIETGYAVHYNQGGCNVNTRCETDKPNLYAIGEVASGSKDGSDRMMSNALPYCMCTGIVGGREATQKAKSMPSLLPVDGDQVEQLKKRVLTFLERQDGVRVYEVKPRLQKMMGEETEYGRTEEGLQKTIDLIEDYKKNVLPRLMVKNKATRLNFEWLNALEFENMTLVAECIARNALLRKESRGLHDRWDYPNPSPDWFKNIHLRLVDGELKQWTTPVEFTYWKPEPGSLGEPTKRGVQLQQYTGWRAQPLHERLL